MKMFLDCEFTELSKGALLISIALYVDEQTYFYAELNDVDIEQVNEWVSDNVVSKLEFRNIQEHFYESGSVIKMKADKENVRIKLSEWLAQFDTIEIWGDVPHYDWVLFCDLLGGAMHIPKNIFYACFDLATLFRIKGFIEPVGKYEKDISRYEFVEANKNNQHNALEDAKTEMLCWKKLIKDE